jgi:hypothetical protein
MILKYMYPNSMFLKLQRCFTDLSVGIFCRLPDGSIDIGSLKNIVRRGFWIGVESVGANNNN